MTWKAKKTPAALPIEPAMRADAEKMWRAQCDGAADPAFEVERQGAFVFIVGTLWNGSRSRSVQVGWDDHGEPYVWEGTRRWRFMEVGTRPEGMLVPIT